MQRESHDAFRPELTRLPTEDGLIPAARTFLKPLGLLEFGIKFLQGQALTAGHPIQQFLNGHNRSPFELGVRFQPLSDFLFRTEEIVNPSAPSEENPGRGRIQFFDFPVLESDIDPLAAVL